jgi:hypothetical protein
MPVWHLYPVISASMPFQMALDEILFRRYVESAQKESLAPVLRFYFSYGEWVSLGYSQRPEEAQSRQAVCRRISGGGRVRHGNDLIFSLIAHKSAHESFREVRTSYLAVHTAVKLAIEKLGKQARFYRCTENLPKGSDCFRYPIASDLAVGAGKAAGGAQKRSCGILLHHESIQYPGMDAWALMKSLTKSFSEVFGADIQPLDLDPELMHEGERRMRTASQGQPPMTEVEGSLKSENFSHHLTDTRLLKGTVPL